MLAARRLPASQPSRQVAHRSETKAYLAGPINGLTFDDATGWRQTVTDRLASSAPHIRCVDPMRGNRPGDGPPWSRQGRGLPNASTIVARDLWDVRAADIVLMNLLGATTTSIGCMIELGCAHAHGAFLVVVLDGRGRDSANCRPINPHDHLFVRELASAVVESLSDAVAIMESL